MRVLLTIGSAIALSLFVVACSDDDRPNEVPRTVPSASTNGNAPVAAPVVKGVGPAIEALAVTIADS